MTGTGGSGKVMYFPRKDLKLEPDVRGAHMWAISLEKVMLTYFEIEPFSRFEKHTHESEQITMVLEGELNFEVGDTVFCVKEGEVIAIPSWVPHAVFAAETRAKAVDAWSPVMEQYKY